MARGYANYGIPSHGSAQYRLTHSRMAARLVELAGMAQDVIDISPGGPEWRFHRDGQEVITKPGLTLTLADGGVAYWSALEHRFSGDLPDWAKVQQFHAGRLGASSWVLTDAFIQDHAVEVANRTDAYYFLAHARGWDGADVEQDILMSVHRSPQTLVELGGKLRRPFSHVYAAALRLWKRSLVRLPMTTQPMNERWLVEGAPHGLR